MRQLRQQATAPETIRERVTCLVNASPEPMTGLQVSHAARLTYKQANDALNALLNQGRVMRHGAKFTARWWRIETHHHTHNPAADALNAVFGLFQMRPTDAQETQALQVPADR